MQKLIMLKVTLALIGILSIDKVEASTSVFYNSPCQYINATGEMKISTTCKVSFGFMGARPEGASYVLLFPNKAKVYIYDYFKNGQPNGQAEANGIPSVVANTKKKVVVLTEQGEIFIFDNYVNQPSIDINDFMAD